MDVIFENSNFCDYLGLSIFELKIFAMDTFAFYLSSIQSRRYPLDFVIKMNDAFKTSQNLRFPYMKISI
jgi:hypothetical protein